MTVLVSVFIHKINVSTVIQMSVTSSVLMNCLNHHYDIRYAEEQSDETTMKQLSQCFIPLSKMVTGGLTLQKTMENTSFFIFLFCARACLWQ